MSMKARSSGADRTARDIAAYLIQSLLDGFISIRELTSPWPQSTSDPALHEISARLGEKVFACKGSSAKRERFANQAPVALTREQRELLERARLFLQTDREYAWPKASFENLVGCLGCLAIVCFAIAFPVALILLFLLKLPGGWVLYPIIAGIVCMLLCRLFDGLGKRGKERAMEAVGDACFYPFTSGREVEEARTRPPDSAGSAAPSQRG